MTTRAVVRRSETDIRNAVFWNELCGSALARSLGITDSTPESLQKFDEAYMAMYPYLSPYVTAGTPNGEENPRNRARLRNARAAHRIAWITASTSAIVQSRC
jgi:hypothetical protein